MILEQPHGNFSTEKYITLTAVVDDDVRVLEYLWYITGVKDAVKTYKNNVYAVKLERNGTYVVKWFMYYFYFN